ncbi:MAG TPA: ABC transporter permease [Actinomycetota bacterium]|jgi:lipopolysaccharide transport system permease protein|nr:ABC transporter permease [Actinomycetota bacterium]
MSTPTEVVIEPARRWPRPRLAELWENRELAFFLVLRNLKALYRQTFIGVAWSLFRPLVTTVIFTIFIRLVKVPTLGIPAPLFVLSGLLPWTFFANSVYWGSLSLVVNAPLVTKIYFPRIVLPLANVLTESVDLVLSLVLLAVLSAVYGVALGAEVLLLPVLLLWLIVTCLSVTLWLAAINVRYRDVAFIVPFMIQIWLYLTPVIYPGQLIPEWGRWAYALNPMVGVVESFRWALVGGPAPTSFIGPSLAVVVVLVVTGWWYFSRTEQTFADVI